MFRHVDDKLQTMTAGLLTFGSVALVMGFFSLFTVFSLQVFSATLFFMVAFLAFYTGYKIHVMQCTLRESIPFGMGMPEMAKSKKRSRR